MQKLSALALGIAILGATGANAAPTFVLKNVQFTDGASIVGSFTTNDALTIVTNWNVTTGPGATSSFFDVPGTTTGASYAPAPIFSASTSARPRSPRRRLSLSTIAC